MKVLTTRAGSPLHASRSCPQLAAIQRKLEIEERDAVPGATRCQTVECQSAFRKAA